VAKARADVILISGYDGGTGASPLSSIRYAGVPWELGLSETQQTLVRNHLRHRVRLQVDGQLKTGRDVIVAALLGAEEFGFATAALVALGCVMMRQCHHNTCPVGVATQDPRLRRLFRGKPEDLVNFFGFVAEEVREHLAALGFRRLDEIIGRSDLLDVNGAVAFWKARGLDFGQVLRRAEGDVAPRCTEPQDHELDQALDWQILPQVRDALETRRPVEVAMTVRNVNRAVGTIVSGEVARRYGHGGLPDDTIRLRFRGSAGQSFGAWLAHGVTLELEGEANDYLGKGLSGGRIVVKPFPGTAYDASANAIAGNVLLYGATAGEAYLCGRAGERFAIRNSGAIAVVEGVGDHGCEYMTGGRVVVLGPTGLNFAAGMSGGIAYVYDADGGFDGRCNLDMVDLELVNQPEDVEELRGLLARHAACTGSRRAAELLERWEDGVTRFVKVFPTEYRRALGRMTREDEATERAEVWHG
jgi:glutamate synthase domain-containing protein 3